jgi:non-lysosomal glucosylceramidase
MGRRTYVMAVPLMLVLAACQTLAQTPLAHWDFETGDLQGWRVVSGNLGKQPSSNDNDRWQGNFDKQGKWFLGTYEGASDQATGELRSPVFTIQGDALGLLVGGGSDVSKVFVALVLVEGDREVRRATGENREVMRPVRWDVTAFRGKQAYLRVVDNATGGWGHINVDDFRELSAEEAARLDREEQQRKEALRLATEQRYQQWRKGVLGPSEPTVYRGANLTNCWMPLGGIGAGSVALYGDGSLRQWQVMNHVNSDAQVPYCFLAVRARAEGHRPITRVLQTSPVDELPLVAGTEFVGEFPVAKVHYLDNAIPLDLTLVAHTSLIPQDAKNSALPLVFFTLQAKNRGSGSVQFATMMSVQNFLGWDGFRRIDGQSDPGFGMNQNWLVRDGDRVSLCMDKFGMDRKDRNYGSLALTCLEPSASAAVAWQDVDDLWADFVGDGRLDQAGPKIPSAPGRTYSGALAVRMTLAPGEKAEVPFLLTWYFPNRYAEYQENLDKYRLGNMYNNWFGSAEGVARYAAANFSRLRKETLAFHDTFYDSNLPYWLVDCVSSQISTLTSQTCLWIEDGSFHGFEGCSRTKGCCPMNCTHVWNYEQTLAHLYPELERKMRHTDFFVQQEDSGAIRHRTVLPLSLPRGTGPFCDGHLSSISKAYREHLLSADGSWLKTYWPRIKQAMEWAISNYDPDGDGCIQVAQPNTYDCTIWGNNTFIGSQWLAALRAAEEMARRMGETATAERYHDLYERGRAKMDRDLWNGEWWIQDVDLKEHPQYEYATGCHSDQLLGQWWADLNDLGHVLPPEHVQKALQSIFANNFLKTFEGFRQSPRAFASNDEMGLIVCSWPRGGRPPSVTLYSDEVWTGMEYEVAALLIRQGLPEEGLQVVKAARDRYNGTRRSPWNEIECGDHYARAMSSYSLLPAVEGLAYDGPAGRLRFTPRLQPQNLRAFFAGAEGYGTLAQIRSEGRQVDEIKLARGRLRLRQWELEVPAGLAGSTVSVTLRDTLVPVQVVRGALQLVLTFPVDLVLGPGDVLRVTIGQ